MREELRLPRPEKAPEDESSAEELRNSSVWLSKEQAESMEYVGNVQENPGRRLRIMRTSDGRLFCELEKKPSRQAATAIILKGIVPVCDVKMVTDAEGPHYYSYMVPIENELFKGEQTDEIETDAKIISLLFNGEHWAGHSLKNVRLDETHRAIFFDFDQTSFDLSPNKKSIRSQLEYTREVHPTAINLIKEKFTRLKISLDEESGEKWFKDALKHVGYDPQEDGISRTYEEYELRVAQGREDNGENEYRININELLIRVRNKIDEILEVLDEKTN